MNSNQKLLDKYHQFFNADYQKKDAQALDNFFAELSDEELNTLLTELDNHSTSSKRRAKVRNSNSQFKNPFNSP